MNHDPLTDGEFAALMAPLGPFGPEPSVAVAVSGGPHSLALAILARRWIAPRGGSVLGIVVDHGLRAGSATEAQGVAATLAGLGIAARLHALALPPGSRIQERAREARLSALLSICGEDGRPWLLMGHHRGDQAETLLFRALRGSGDHGLAAMAPVRVAGPALVLRPLLRVAAGRLEATCMAAGLVPVRDPSNDDRRFTRVQLRQALRSTGRAEATEQALALAAEGFSRRRAAHEGRIAQRVAAAIEFLPDGAVRIEGEGFGRDAVAVAVLGRLIRLLGGARHLPPSRAVRQLLDRRHGTLGRTWLRASSRGTLLLSAERQSRARSGAVPLARPEWLGYGPVQDAAVDLPRGGAVT